MTSHNRIIPFSCLLVSLLGCEATPDNSVITDKSAGFSLNQSGYFQNRGVGVMAFQEHHPESHQSGLIIVMHGSRVATNGDLRLEATPGQWSPVPKVVDRIVDPQTGSIRTTLAYPDEKQNRKGFNPINYPDLELTYSVDVSAHGDAIKVRVDLDQPLPEAWVGKVGFLLELY